MVDDFAQVLVAVLLVVQDHVVADAGCHEDLLDALQLADFAQQVDLRLVVDFEHGTDIRRDAALGRADAALEFLVALEAVHVGGRAAQILNVTFEFGMLCQPLGFSHDGFLTAPADRASLVDSDGAEVALAVTAAMGGDRKADRIQQAHGTLLLVVRMLRSFVVQRVNGIKLGLCLMRGRRVLDQPAVAVLLAQSLCAVIGSLFL